MSIKEALINYKKRTKEISFCGEAVTIQAMSGSDFSKFVDDFDSAKNDIEKAALILIYSIVEDGRRVFTTKDMAEITMIEHRDLREAATKASEFCGLRSEEGSKEAEGNC